MPTDPKLQEEYRQAYDAWQRQVQDLHRVFLDGDAMEPPKLKVLLNREARKGTLRRGGAGVARPRQPGGPVRECRVSYSIRARGQRY